MEDNDDDDNKFFGISNDKLEDIFHICSSSISSENNSLLMDGIHFTSGSGDTINLFNRRFNDQRSPNDRATDKNGIISYTICMVESSERIIRRGRFQTTRPIPDLFITCPPVASIRLRSRGDSGL
ncbi:hypothetical protein DERP_008466 [Dermatophagoides pteronyssinus]|uniref:Uncharacterized protein n=1 Tax=Dermatophagoides pteronyssinus TaxID=6956 RepID=A0ABQ8IVC9_DERPT|nr:hypothetical protein DERP_008466 [Dermatophagoides pteronyssinus]